MARIIQHDEYGHFSADGKAFIITTPQTPRHWYNYLWNRNFVSLVSQTGQGEAFSQDALGRRIPLLSARMLFLRDQDSGELWAANGLPVAKAYQNYRCKHALGCTTIALRYGDIATAFRIFTPQAELCEVWTLRVANEGKRERRLQIFPFADTLLDGPAKPQAYYMSRGYWQQAQQAIIVSAYAEFDRAEQCFNFLTASQPISGFDSRERAFVGYGTWQAPEALLRGGCTNSFAEMDKPIFALENRLSLKPGEEASLHFIVGTVFDEDEIGAMRRKFFQREGVEAELRRVQRAIDAELGQTAFVTPDETLNRFTLHWLKRQISLGTLWARVRHNGFRDLMQDIGAMAFFNPQAALERLERVLAFQYSSGYAPRTWLNGQVLDKDFSDNHVWIACTVHNLVMETGDLAILDREVPFNDGSSASIYEHVKRAVDYLWEDRGRFGLCRIHSGDWNDCLDQVGPQGRGVSVWLSMAWYLANRQFAELARLKGEVEHAKTAGRRADEMRQAVDRYAWDGDYYLRAFDDDGAPIGSHLNTEGTLYLNPQSWAVLSGIAQGDKGARALVYAEDRLQTPLGIRSVEKAYSFYQPNIGCMSRKTPGIQENGGVYLHASAFKLAADCLLKRREAVERGIYQMLPFGRADSLPENDGEPYIFSNCYFAIEGSYRYGTAGQSWGTGTAGWFYAALLNHVFGLKPEMAGLRVDPCLPPSWTECCVIRQFRGATYRITYRQEKGGGELLQITVNGREWRGGVLPYQAGQEYQVTVNVMW